MGVAPSFWKRCSSCKKELPFGADYWACNVSTCNQNRTALVFCSVSCWEVHLSVVRHRESWAVERKAPGPETRAAQAPAAPRGEPTTGAAGTAPPSTGRRIYASAPAAAPGSKRGAAALPREILVVVSKLKGYIRARSGMNTSDDVTGILSDKLRDLCDQAIDHARRDGRRTVMERDFEKLV